MKLFQLLITAFFDQNKTDSMYFFLSRMTPEPPSDFPREFRIIVIGSIGIIPLCPYGFTDTMPQS